MARAEEYDAWTQNLADATEIDDIKLMRKRHVDITTTMQSKVNEYLQAITDQELRRMSPDAAMRLLDVAIKNERVARDVPDSIHAITNRAGGPAQVDLVSDDVLDRKLGAYMMSRDPKNVIERGEPNGPDVVEDDILAETMRVKQESAEGEWPSEGSTKPT